MITAEAETCARPRTCLAQSEPWRTVVLFNLHNNQFSSVTQLCPTLCNPTDCSTPGFLVLHHLLELAQSHVHWISDAILPSRPLLPPSPPSFPTIFHNNNNITMNSSSQRRKLRQGKSEHLAQSHGKHHGCEVGVPTVSQWRQTLWFLLAVQFWKA